MKVIKLTKNGILSISPTIASAKRGGKYFCFTHGEEGRGRWAVKFPLGVRDFPVNLENPLKSLPAENTDYNLVDLKKRDRGDNNLYLLGKGIEDGKFLVFWWLSPGFRGGARYSVEGCAKVLASGYQAQGTAGRMGGAECPVVLVEGDCILSWRRTGRLYGDPADWVASYNTIDGWRVCEKTDCVIEDAAFNY